MAPRTGSSGRRIGRLAAAAGLTVLLASCGGSGAATTTSTTTDASRDGSASSAQPSITGSSSSTTTPRPAADDLTIVLATAAPLLAIDFPAGWTVHTEARVHALTTDSCSYREDGPEADLGTGAAQDGPTMQLGDEPGFITSTARVFPDDAAAKAWLETVRSEEWAECRAEQLTEFQDENRTGVEVTLDTREVDQLGENGFEAYAQFYGRDADGDISSVLNVMHYRLGRVVLEDTLERSIVLDEADWAAVDNAHGVAVASAWVRLNELPIR